MPKYTYRCNACEKTWDEWHSMSEIVTDCECGSSFVFRIPNNFITINQTVSTGNKKVGEATKEGIEKNREVLKKMQQEARSNEFTVDD